MKVVTATEKNMPVHGMKSSLFAKSTNPLNLIDTKILLRLAEKKFQAAISGNNAGNDGFIFLQGEPAI